MPTGAPTALPRRSIPWAVLGGSLALTAGAAWYVDSATRAYQEQRLERRAQADLELIERRLDSHVALLRATAAMFGTSEQVTEAEYRQYVEHLDLTGHYPGIQGLGWAERVAPGEPLKDSPDLVVWPTSPGPDQYAISYLEPLDARNAAALGYDMNSDPVRREAIERAVDTGQPAASGSVTLMQEIDHDRQRGFLLYVPVYAEGAEGATPATVQERRDRATGVVYIAFRADDFFEVFFTQAHESALAADVYDGPPTPENLLRRAPAPYDQLTSTSILDVGGRSWTVIHRAVKRPEAASVPVLPIVIAGGVSVSFLLFALVWGQQSAQRRAMLAARELALSEAELRVSEERFRTTIEQSPLAITIFAPTGEVRHVNRAAEELFGQTLADFQGWNLLTDPLVVARGKLPLLEHAFRVGPIALPIDEWPIAKGQYGGQTRWTRAFAYPLQDAKGEVREVVILHEDVTDRVQAEAALRQAQKLESIGVLAGGVAHDFNNLLTGVLGYANLAARKIPPDHPAQALIAQILAAGARASDLTRQLLAYAGKGKYFVRRIDLGRTIQDIGALVHASVPREVQIVLDLGDEPLPVDADGSQIQQLVMNLVINAAEAAGERGGHVRVTTRARFMTAADLQARFPGKPLAEGAYLVLEVQDDGPGMSAETMARIFDPFFTTKFMGRGLGLAAAMGIVNGHHGAMAVDSREGEGTTFTVALPRAEGEAEPDRPPSPRELTGSETVLVVDDEAVVRDSAARILQDHGYHVLAAVDGPEALELFARHSHEIDLVLLDLAMPGMGGDEVQARMLDRRPDTLVVITSGYGETEAMRRLSGRPVQGFVPKPWTIQGLVGTIRAALDARQAARAARDNRPPAGI